MRQPSHEQNVRTEEDGNHEETVINHRAGARNRFDLAFTRLQRRAERRFGVLPGKLEDDELAGATEDDMRPWRRSA